MKLAYALCLLPLYGFSCGVSAPPKPHVNPGRYVKTVKEGAIERSYVLRVPKGYDNKTNLPLVLVFHGLGSSADEAETYTQFGPKADKEGFILAVPNGTAGLGEMKGWNTGFLNLGTKDADDVKFTTDILDQVEKDLYVDQHCVYVAGFSNGAMMSYVLGAKLSDRIAAIGVVSGSIGLQDQRVPAPESPVSAIIFHGNADQMVAYDAASTALLHSIPAPESAKWWAAQDGCDPTAKIQMARGVIVNDYKSGKNNTEVEFVTIDKGDHSWPDGSEASAHISAADMIWSFFKAHPKR